MKVELVTNLKRQATKILADLHEEGGGLALRRSRKIAAHRQALAVADGGEIARCLIARYEPISGEQA